MRYRTTILFLLACLLAGYPALQANRETSACADRYPTGDSGNALALDFPAAEDCTGLVRHGQMERLVNVLAGVCALGGCASAANAWRERQQDRALLRGVRTSLWWRGLPYR